LQRQLPLDRRLIEQLDKKFEAVALNLVDGNIRLFDRGDLVQAMIASSTIPGLFEPVRIGSGLCVDGGIGANIPTFKAKQAGANLIIAVAVDNSLRPIPPSKLIS